MGWRWAMMRLRSSRRTSRCLARASGSAGVRRPRSPSAPEEEEAAAAGAAAGADDDELSVEREPDDETSVFSESLSCSRLPWNERRASALSLLTLAPMSVFRCWRALDSGPAAFSSRLKLIKKKENRKEPQEKLGKTRFN